MAKRQVKPGIVQGSVGSEKDVMLGIKTLAGQSSGFLEQAAKVSPRKAAAVARSRLEERDQVMDEALQELELDVKSEDQVTGRKEAGKTVLPGGERAVSPVYSDPLSPHPSESSPSESPLSTATSLSPTHKHARNPQAHTTSHPQAHTSIIRTRRGSSTEHGHSASETDTKRPLPETGSKRPQAETSTKHPQAETGTKRPQAETGTKRPQAETSTKCPLPEIGKETPSKLLHLSNGERGVVTLVSDVPEIPSVRPKRGPFHRGSQKTRTAEAGHPPPPPPLQLPPPPPPPPITKTTTSPIPTSASPLDIRSSPLTRSSSAALKSVEFVSLPGRKRRRGRGEEGGGDSTGASPSLDPVSPDLDHTKSVGDGGGGGGGGSGGVESPTTTKSERDTCSPVDMPQVKRKRGRPPKKRREAGPPNHLMSDTPTNCAMSVESGGPALTSLASSSPESLSTLHPPPPLDAHSSPYGVATPIPTLATDGGSRGLTPSPQTILAFEESPLPPAGFLKTSVEQSHTGPKALEQSHIGPKALEQSHTGPKALEQSHTGPKALEQSHTGPASEQSHTGPRASEQSHAGPRASEQSHTGPRALEHSHTGPRASEQSHTGPRALEQSHTGPRALEQSHTGPRALEQSHTGPRASEQAPVPFGKSAEPTTKAIPPPVKPPVAHSPEINNLPLWESFGAKQPGASEQKACNLDVPPGKALPHCPLPPVQTSLKPPPSWTSEFGGTCYNSVPTIPSLLTQTVPKTTGPLLCHPGGDDPMALATTITTFTSIASSSPGHTPTGFTVSSATEAVKRDLPPCVDQSDATRLIKPNDGTATSVTPATTSMTPATTSVTPAMTSVTPAMTSVPTVSTAGDTEGEGRNGADQSHPLLPRGRSTEGVLQSESKEQRMGDAHDGVAIASAPDGESPAKPEGGEKAESTGAEPVYLTKPLASPPSVGYKPSKQDKPLESVSQQTSSSALSVTKPGERREECPSEEKGAPNPMAQDPDSKSRSKIPELDIITSMCYTMANPTAHYPPLPTAYPPSSYPHYSFPMYTSYYPPPPPSQQIPGAYLPGIHLPMTSEQTSGGGFYATPLSHVTTRPPAPPPVATTVSGVRVAILDKPPPQLPALQGGSSLSRPQVGTSGNFAPLPGEHGQPSSMGRLQCSAVEGQPGAPSRGSQPHPHPLTQVYRTGSAYNPFYPPYQEYVISGEQREPAPPPVKSAPPKVQDSKPPTVEEQHLPTQPVECPECGRMFKNNKALNGHMRLHGGFDWTKKPFGMGVSLEGGARNNAESKAKRSEASKNVVTATAAAIASGSPSPPPGKSDHARPHVPPKVFTFNNTDGVKVKREASESVSRHHHHHHHHHHRLTEHRNPTLDDLCRAVEELERKEKEATSDVQRHRPSNITIPQSSSGGGALMERERRKLSVSPPYTPPPILSPARGSMSLMASPQVQPHTPNRILSHWNGRRSTTDSIKPSDSEESSFMEPKINVGKEFQAELPELIEFRPDLVTDERASKVWAPIENLTLEEECTLDGYLELACSSSVPYGGRNKEYALHVLHYIGGSIKEAVRVLLLGKSPFPIEHHLNKYNYISTKKWTARERQQFRRAWRVHRKQFKLLRDSCAQVGSTKTLPEIIEHYYTWKKYRNDEYRCRNRHASEEILTDDDDAYPELHSSSSSGSTEQETTHAELHRQHGGGGGDKADRHEKQQDKLDLLQADRADQKLLHAPAGLGTSADPAEHLPVVYAPHTPRPSPGQPVHQYKCKYPGCNQVFTSIFALNGHIRIHGGSWYPKPYKADSCSSGNSQGNSLGPLSSGHLYPSSGKQKSLGEDPRLYHPHYELTKVLSLEVPQPSGSASSYGVGCNNAPSPKPSPGKQRSPPKKKMSSSSPGEREGYYPCNRCGRVFTKVKSRSAHMKSHIIKQS